MRAQSQIAYAQKGLIRDVNYQHTDDYFIETVYDRNLGLTIKVLSMDLIAKGNMLYLSISKDTMSDSLKSSFQNLYQLFLFMKSNDNVSVDLKYGIMKLKIIKIVGSKNIDASIQLVMEDKQLTNDKLVAYSVKIWGQKIEQKLENYRVQTQQKIQRSERKFDYLSQEIKTVDRKSLKKSEQSKGVYFVGTFIAIVAIIILMSVMNKEKITKTQLTKQQIQTIKNSIQKSIRDNILKQTEKYSNQINIALQNRINQIENKLIDAKQTLTYEIENLHNKIEIQKARALQRQKVSIKCQLSRPYQQVMQVSQLTYNLNKQMKAATTKLLEVESILKTTTQQYLNVQELIESSQSETEAQIAEHENKFEELSSAVKKMQKIIAELYSTNTSSNQQAPLTASKKQIKKVNDLQTSVEQLTKIVKKMSVFELSSRYIESFDIWGRKATNLAVSGRRTQLLLRDDIPYDSPQVFIFKVSHAQLNTGTISIGVVDAMRVKDRTSLLNNNTVAYSCRGQIWKHGNKQDTTKGSVTSQKQFIIEMEVHLSKGTVKWIVDGTVLGTVTSDRLQDNTMKFRPYVEMANKKDMVEVIALDQL